MFRNKGISIVILAIILLMFSMSGFAYYEYTQESGATFFVSAADKADALEDTNEMRQILDDLGNLLVHSKRDDSYPKDLTTGGTLAIPNSALVSFATGTKGDLFYCSATNVWAKLNVGSDNQILVVATDVPNWETASSALLSDVASIAMLDEAEAIAGTWEVQDDVGLVFGNDADWSIEYDEGVDDQLIFLTAQTTAGADTDPMFEIIVGTSMDEDQQVFGIAKGTQSSNTALFTVDEDGDVIITGALDLGTALPDAEVLNNITIDLATLATTITVTDNESTAENNPICFVAGAAQAGGSLGIETDGTCYYTPSTGTITTTEFVGGGTGLTGLQTTLTNEAGLYAALSDVSLFLEDVVDDTSPELGGEMDAGAHSIGFTLQTATGDGATLINWTTGNHIKFTFGSGNETITFTDPSNPCHISMIIVQDGTGSRTITWSGMTIKWAAGTAPTLTTAANGEDIVSFIFDGTNYYGVASFAFATP